MSNNISPVAAGITSMRTEAAGLAIVEAPAVPQVELPDFTPAGTRQLTDPTAFTHVTGAGHGSVKLSLSDVAPLVAAARGYLTVDDSNLKEVAKALGASRSDSSRGRQLREAVATGDAMLVRWYSMVETAEHSFAGTFAPMTTYQLRPAVELKFTVRGKDKSLKYINPPATPTVLDFHPAMPFSWIEKAPRILFAEGMLKADASLTAILRAAGLGDELMDTQGGNQAAAAKKLRELMHRVEPTRRVVVIAALGCGTWHQSTEWNAIRFSGREILLGFDADAASNFNVWSQAQKLFAFAEKRKAASVQLIALPQDGDGKQGLDDYFAAGNSWDSIDGLLVDLPPQPKARRVSEELVLATVDFRAGTTYEVRTVVMPDGTRVEQETPLADAAIRIDTIENTRLPFNGMPTKTTLTGVVAWVEHYTTGPQRSSKRFSGQSAQLLLGRTANASTVLDKVSDGFALPAKVKPSASPTILPAWLATGNGVAERIQYVRTTGLWTTDDGLFGWLTNDGLLTATGIERSVRAKPEGLPAVELPFIEVDQNPGKVIDAWEHWSGAALEIHPAHEGFTDLTTGMVFATAVGVQPKGTVYTFGKMGLGKSSALKLAGGWMGPEWLEDPSLMLVNKTPAILKEVVTLGNNVMYTLDDIRDAGTVSGGISHKFEEVHEFTDGMGRMTYEPKAEFSKMRLDTGGDYITPPRREGLCRSAIISGESMEKLNLRRSTKDRGIFFDITDKTPMLAHDSTIDGVLQDLAEERAQAILMGATLVRQLQAAEEAVDPRAALKDAVTKMADAENEILKGMQSGPDRRSRQLIAPSLAGVHTLIETVALAYEAQREPAQAETVRRSMDAVRARVVGAWRRHQEFIGNDNASSHTEAIAGILELIDGGLAHFAGEPVGSPQSILLGRKDAGGIYLIPSAVHNAMAKTINKDITRGAVRELFTDLVSNWKKPMGIAGAGSSTRWYIASEAWAEATGEGATVVAVAEEMLRAA